MPIISRTSAGLSGVAPTTIGDARLAKPTLRAERRSVRPCLLALVALAAACAPTGPRVASPAAAPTGGVRVAILGDMPYGAAGTPTGAANVAAYEAVLDTIAAERVDFVVHVGDITGADCSDSLYAQRAREFAAMPHPLVYTFGDNEWTDCARNGHDPLERLTRLRALFTQGEASLGARPMPLERQSADPAHATFRENVRWRRGGVLFVTLHVVGSNNNRGQDSTPPSAEFTTRSAANLAWLRAAFAQATRESARGVAIFMQANPGLERSEDRGRPGPDGFTDLLDELRRLAAAFDRPVALVHGDTHRFRVDQPLVAGTPRRVLYNVTRAETYGNPLHHALLMTVDPDDPNLFRFAPLIVRANARP